MSTIYAVDSKGSRLSVVINNLSTGVLDIWDPGLKAGSQASYSATGQGQLPNFSLLEGGTANPSYTTTPRVWVVPDPTGTTVNPWIRLTRYDSDHLSVVPAGSSTNSAAAAPSTRVVILGNSYYVGWQTLFPDGTKRGNNPFPFIVPGPSHFFQFMEVFGPPWGNPLWQLGVLQINGANRLIVPSYLTNFPHFWESPTPLLLEHPYTFLARFNMSPVASTDGGKTGGFLELWVDGQPVTFASNPQWTLANNGTTLCTPTCPSNAVGPWFADFDAYSLNGLITGIYDPVTIYHRPIGIATTSAAITSRF